MHRVRGLGIALLLLPATVWAHGTLPGAGAVINGLVHPFFVPGHLLLSLVLGLHLGQQEAQKSRLLLPLYSVFLLLGALLSKWIAPLPASCFSNGSIEVLALILSLPVALMVVARLRLPGYLSLIVLLPAALMLGADSVPENMAGFNFYLALIANLFILAYLALWVAAAVWRLERQWQQLGFRILASWMAAVSLLLSAFVLTR